VFPCREIRRTLKTESYREARKLATAWEYKTERVFALARSGMLTKAQILQLVEDYTPREVLCPLIALFSGMRLDEICQLYTEDVKLLSSTFT
jgi:hypothetical protein